MERSRTVYDLLRHQDVADAERAVIEAAKACANEPDKTLGWTDLVAAVAALQAAEGEG